MIRLLAKFILNKVLGFTVITPENAFLSKKRIFAVVPHTSNWDFPLGILMRTSIGLRVNFVGKHSLFKPPLGWLLKYMGGIPINRNTTTNFVDATVKAIKERDEVSLAIAPEGTRGYVTEFKTGFYWIAKNSNIDLILVTWDWGRKKLEFSKPFQLTDDPKADLQKIKYYFKGALGKIPKNSYTADA